MNAMNENMIPFEEKPSLNSFTGKFGDLAVRIQHLLEIGEKDLYRRLTHELDRTILDVILKHVQGNQVHASELLGISRTTLRMKLRSLEMNAEDYLKPKEPETPAENPLPNPAIRPFSF
ncbi:hypothetical protein KIH39_06530 [Telmatocola sphagniphila]|uniref:DNA binding HTH domain-containing protein n=1 Tax=Telmatocola sphagniphila TaxID=1123043 RepID=A0A8E6EZB2_9BACT|nr:helix-turn-helix domain-containing protein [Telmatocola sphagniphila]QVL33563.1 hypothetical protein KIH39_06530 [Telmatocola sphagniphila]